MCGATGMRHVEKKKCAAGRAGRRFTAVRGTQLQKVDQKQTVFEVAASKSIEFKGKDASLPRGRAHKMPHYFREGLEIATTLFTREAVSTGEKMEESSATARCKST